ARSCCSTEEARLWINRSELALSIRPNPRDVIAQRRYFPTLHCFRRNHHCEIRFPARRGKSCSYIRFLALRTLYTENQHVLGHPTFVARDVRCNTQREAFLA